MLTLQLLPSRSGSDRHAGEVHACTYAPDGSYLLSGGWDGCLRQWQTEDGTCRGSLSAGDKPVSACAVAPDGSFWLSGNMDGMLARWDAATHQRGIPFLAHSRPISAIVFGLNEKSIATASWDRSVTLWTFAREREARSLAGHLDIVAGCRFTPDGRTLISWGYDGTLRFWDVAHARRLRECAAHSDRVTACAVSPDGRWAATGSRNQAVKLWDLQTFQEAARVSVAAEVRACFFLLDGESLVTVDAQGRLVLHTLPTLAPRAEVATGCRVQCGDLSPSGGQLALGCEDGQVRFVRIDGFDTATLVVRVTQTQRRTASALQRFFGRSRVTAAYVCKCPVCQQTVDLPGGDPGLAAPCPHCGRCLRVGAVALQEQGA